MEFEGIPFTPISDELLAKARKVFDEPDDGDVSDLPELPDDDEDLTIAIGIPKK